jgi:hypothetical protein
MLPVTPGSCVGWGYVLPARWASSGGDIHGLVDALTRMGYVLSALRASSGDESHGLNGAGNPFPHPNRGTFGTFEPRCWPWARGSHRGGEVHGEALLPTRIRRRQGGGSPRVSATRPIARGGGRCRRSPKAGSSRTLDAAGPAALQNAADTHVNFAIGGKLLN